MKIYLIIRDVILFFGAIYALLWLETYLETDQIKYQKLEKQVQQRNRIDTLYWEHLSQCAFELKDDIKFDQFN